MMPSEEQFAEEMLKINVRKNDLVVVYDKSGMLSAPRAFWMLKTFGLHNVFILNGTFSKWEAEKRQIESGDNERAWTRTRKTIARSDDFHFQLNSSKVKSFEDM